MKLKRPGEGLPDRQLHKQKLFCASHDHWNGITRTPLPSIDSFCGDNEYAFAHPRHNDEHTAGDVDCDQVIRELPFEYKLNLQATVFACKRKTFIIVTFLLCVAQIGFSVQCLHTVFNYFDLNSHLGGGRGVALPRRKFIQLLSNSKSNYACSASHL